MSVSVVIPCRDAEATLPTTLRSVLDQSRPPLEVLVVDDGSRDESRAVAAAFGPPVQVLAGERNSASAARIAGAARARGTALMFLDADDVLGPTVLEVLERVLAVRPDAIAVCPWRRLECVDGQWVTRPASCAPRRAGQDDLEAWLEGWYHPPCALLWSRAAYEHSGGWDPGLRGNDDGCVVMRALARGVELVHADGDRSYYRRPIPGATSLSGTRATREGVRNSLAVLEGLARTLERTRGCARYGPALARAYDELARRCPPGQSDLHRACRRAAARYGGPPVLRNGRRLAQRLGLALAGPRTARSPEPQHPREQAGVEGSPLPATAAAPAAVSVVIPTYERAALLRRALAGVLAQTLPPLEVLVVDDASADDTAAVVAGLGDKRVRYLRQPENRGPGAARNRGLLEARGELVAFLDSDDEWLPRKLALQVERFHATGARCGLVYTGVEVVGAGGDRRVVRPRHRGDVYAAMLAENIVYGGGSNAMVRRTVFARAGVFDEELPAAEDYDLWLRVAQYYHVDYVDQPLVRYHDAPTTDDAERVSRDLAANLAARARLYLRYGPEMRREGVARRFLLESARRELRSEHGDQARGRRLVLRALAQEPAALSTYPWLPYMLLPSPARRGLRAFESVVRRRLGQRPGPEEEFAPRGGVQG